MAAIIGLLLQYLEEGGQGVAVASLGETRHRLGSHGGQLSKRQQPLPNFPKNDRE
ncbi:MAG: hypothetical protein OXF79_00460 [Chloroflexi bacterium]|nr:hypothetical protein [Chloroflexota bacterium]